MPISPLAFLASVLAILVDVLQFWRQRIHLWWITPTPQDALIQRLKTARDYEEWQEAAMQLDQLQGHDLWRHNPASRWYDYRLINSRLQSLSTGFANRDFNEVVNVLRSGLVRNLGNLTTPRLYCRAYGGTKLLIEDYITQATVAIDFVASYPSSSGATNGRLLEESDSSPSSEQPVNINNQVKVDILHDTRLAFGRSVLVLQGGSILALYHLGVIKALYLASLLPRIIVGTAAGAIITAVVGVCTDEELEELFFENMLDLTAFDKQVQVDRPEEEIDVKPAGNKGELDPNESGPHTGWLNIDTLKRRLLRYVRHGHFLDKTVLEQCVRANVGEFTFDEAYSRTRRVINITVTNSRGVPRLLNYLTAPHVIIWTAALVSHASTSGSLYTGSEVLFKDPSGQTRVWDLDNGPAANPAESASAAPDAPAPGGTKKKDGKDKVSHAFGSTNEHGGPLSRVAEMFNVNHFIISQARPYLAPFLRSELYHPPTPGRHPLGFLAKLLPLGLPPPLSWLMPAGAPGVPSPQSSLLPRLIFMEIHHRLHQLDSLSLLPTFLRRLLLDETVPGGTSTSVVTVVPELYLRDLVRLLDNPSADLVAHFIRRGERAIWPAICALKARCSIEVELDRGYQKVRRRKPFDQSASIAEGAAATAAAFQAARAARRTATANGSGPVSGDGRRRNVANRRGSSSRAVRNGEPRKASTEVPVLGNPAKQPAEARRPSEAAIN